MGSLMEIRSGGQTGWDQAAWRAAKRCGFATGGWMPMRFITEAGPRPEFAGLYGAQEFQSTEYPPRTRQNVADAQATFWMGKKDHLGLGCTMKACKALKKPSHMISDLSDPMKMVRIISEHGYTVINIAGSRESKDPGIGRIGEAFIVEVFQLLLKEWDV